MSNLDFLDEILKPQTDKYINPSFLGSHFNDSIWIIKFNDGKTTKVDFNVSMRNNTLLTDQSNKNLLTTLKNWIIESIYYNDSHNASKSIMRSRIYNVLTLFDCFNINDNHLDMTKNGLSLITSDFLKYILTDLAGSNDKFNGVYKLSERCFKFYKKKQCVTNETNQHGTLDDLSSEDLDNFNSYLIENKIKVSDLYKDTILKPRKFPEDINQQSESRVTREYPSYFRTKENEVLSKDSYRGYLKALNALKLLINRNKDKSLQLPMINEVEEALDYFPDTSKSKRFETFPSSFVFTSFKKAIEFHYNYGESISKTYYDFVTKLNNHYDKNSKFLFTNEVESLFQDSLCPKLKELGVIKFKTFYTDKNKYTDLRENKCFYDLLQVYFGATQLVVGALMARRQSELSSLISGDCIDEHSSSLLFKRSKSHKGLFGLKDTLALPIDPLAIEMIRNIEYLQSAVDGKHYLLSLPKMDNPMLIKTKPDNTSYGTILDLFFDYIEAPVIDGKRLYLRQHQLRRFFAMTFFWSSGFGSLDTLRWFMGHTDIQHVYHYITESTPGEVLRSVKAQYAKENIKSNADLAELIKEKYNTDDFELVESEDLTYYIEDLIEEGQVQVEPEFIEDDNGVKYEIVIKVINEE